MTNLKPCPFCGVVPKIRSNRDWHKLDIDHQEHCILDGRDFEFPADDEALQYMIEIWNTRSEPEKLQRDMSIGAGTFKAGIPLETFLKAVDRQNPYFLRLMRDATPKQMAEDEPPAEGDEL